MTLKKYWNQNKKSWIIVIILIVLIKIFSLNIVWVETLYATKFYFYFSRLQRILFGWIPFSIGDVLYFFVILWMLWNLVRGIKLLISKRLSWKNTFYRTLNLLLGIAIIYVIFNIFWGINYNRKGITYQLKLPDLQYDSSDLILLQNLLVQKVNASKIALLHEGILYPDNKELIKRAKKCYDETERVYPFLRYKNLSVKSSFYGWLGNYLGFTGYYNPLTGEAQINTAVPKFLQPYVSTHEMAHQLGYAKENVANFVGYLAAVNSHDTLFHYSAYFDLFIYANREVYFLDSNLSRNAAEQLIPEVKEDIQDLRQFDIDHQSIFEPAIRWLYGNFLKMNQQPQGIHSYNEVIGLLISYYKKYGKI